MSWCSTCRLSAWCSPFWWEKWRALTYPLVTRQWQQYRDDVNTWYLLVLQVDQTWANSTILDVLSSVPEYKECQALCRVCIREDTFMFQLCNYEISRTKPGVRAGPGYQRQTLTSPNIVWRSQNSEILKTHPTVSGREKNYIMTLPIFIYSILHSGPPSCLCSEVGECINTGDNEVEVVPNISQVKSFHIEGNIESTYKFFLGRKVPGPMRHQPWVSLLHLVKMEKRIVETIHRYITLTVSGSIQRLECWATCVCCSPAALRETPPVPPVILPLCPAVNR